MKELFAHCMVLVTGGAGFIGSHVTHRLVEWGAHVTVLDNLSTGKKENITSILDRITLIEGDITNQETCMLAAQNQKIIFHLAALVSVPESLENPLACFKTNVLGTSNILEAARKQNVERVIIASSSAVYGQKKELCRETDICNPTSPYGYSKMLAEQLAQQYTQIFNLPTLSLRFFNVWGERQNPEGHYAAVVAKFKYNLEKNLPITIFGDGLQTRDFIYVGDVVTALLSMAQIPLPLLQGQAINIATGKSITILDLITQLKQEFIRYTGTILFEPERPGDIRHSSADCSQYRYLSGFIPSPDPQFFIRSSQDNF